MNDSYTYVPCERVASTARDRIKQIEVERARRWHAAISQVQAEQESLRKYIPWLPSLSAEDARKQIIDKAGWGPTPSNHACGRYRRCQLLLRLAQVTPNEGKCLISAEDVEVLGL